mmetsp:Transcript_14434/g.39490  ORF Transcript_14434/g.39490 Transcript_14434/m.39490 type:complete len:207 (+) Transcript_14434:142-762(+)
MSTTSAHMARFASSDILLVHLPSAGRSEPLKMSVRKVTTLLTRMAAGCNIMVSARKEAADATAQARACSSLKLAPAIRHSHSAKKKHMNTVESISTVTNARSIVMAAHIRIASRRCSWRWRKCTRYRRCTARTAVANSALMLGSVFASNCSVLCVSCRYLSVRRTDSHRENAKPHSASVRMTCSMPRNSSRLAACAVSAADSSVAP